MNIVQQSEMLKGIGDDRLFQEMRQPSGQFPLYMVTSEAKRRADLRQGAAGAQATPPTTTVQQELMAALAGQHAATQPKAAPGPQGPPPPQRMSPQMPPQGGVGSAPRMLPPQGITAAPPQQAAMPPEMTQGPAQMASGKPQGFAQGGLIRGFANGAYRTPGQDVGERARLIRGAAANRRAAIANQEELARAQAARDYNTEMTRQDIDIPPYDMPPGKFSEADVRPPVGRMADRPVPYVGVGEEGDSPIPEYMKPFMQSNKREGVQIDPRIAPSPQRQATGFDFGSRGGERPPIISSPATRSFTDKLKAGVQSLGGSQEYNAAQRIQREDYQRHIINGETPAAARRMVERSAAAVARGEGLGSGYVNPYDPTRVYEHDLGGAPTRPSRPPIDPEVAGDDSIHAGPPIGVNAPPLSASSGSEESFSAYLADAEHYGGGSSSGGGSKDGTETVGLNQYLKGASVPRSVAERRRKIMQGLDENGAPLKTVPGVVSPPNAITAAKHLVAGGTPLTDYKKIPDATPLPNQTKLLEMAREQVAANHDDPYTKFADILKEREAKSKGADNKDFWMDVAAAGFGMAKAGSKPGATVLGSMADGGGDFLTAATASKKARTERADKNLALDMQITGLKRQYNQDMEALAVAQAKGEIDMYKYNNEAKLKRVGLQNDTIRAKNADAQRQNALAVQEKQHSETTAAAAQRHSQTTALRTEQHNETLDLQYAKEENRFNIENAKMGHTERLAEIQRKADPASVKAYKFVSGIEDKDVKAKAERLLFPKSLVLSAEKKRQHAIYLKALTRSDVDLTAMQQGDYQSLSEWFDKMGGDPDYMSLFYGSGVSNKKGLGDKWELVGGVRRLKKKN